MNRGAVADPEALERFASQLKAYNDGLRESSAQLTAAFRQLGELWRDQEHQKFAQEFEQAMRVIGRFLEESAKHEPFLRRKAQRIWDYLGQR